jgi:hypothetical protein
VLRHAESFLQRLQLNWLIVYVIISTTCLVGQHSVISGCVLARQTADSALIWFRQQ